MLLSRIPTIDNCSFHSASDVSMPGVADHSDESDASFITMAQYLVTYITSTYFFYVI